MRREAVVAHHRLASSVEPMQVAGAAALGDEAPARLQRGEQTRKQAIVIADPVKRRRAEHRVSNGLEWQRCRVSPHEADVKWEGGDQVPSRRREHVL